MDFLKNFINYFKTFSQKTHFTGVLSDDRPVSEIVKDYLHEERLPSSPATIWFDRPFVSPYLNENQNDTSSCVAHATTMAWSITTKNLGSDFTRLSKMFVYKLRTNFPSPGCNMPEMMDRLKKVGSCLYTNLPTPFTEEMANSVSITAPLIKEASENKKLVEYYKISNARDIDLLASISATGVGISLLIFATYKEWAQKYPQVIPGTVESVAPIRHGVCILDRGGFIENGIKYLAIVDSSWFGDYKIRYLSEDFIKNRVFKVDGAAYFDAVSIMDSVKPSNLGVFVGTMEKGDIGELVLNLQKVLLYEGFLPADCVIGTFGPRTVKAVTQLQEKYASEILNPVGLTKGTGLVGPSTINWLNLHYGS